MAKVTVEAFGVIVSIEDNNESFNTLLSSTRSQALSMLNEKIVQKSLKVLNNTDTDDGTDPDGKIPPKKEEHGMFQ